GELRVEILLTPGHTPEHICVFVHDTSQPDAPPILFSGDTLFVNSVGRPDLLGEQETQRLAVALYQTIHKKLMALDENTIVYPGHGAGSACGKAIGNEPSTTIGQEKRFNHAFRPVSQEQFVATILDGLPEPPPYFPVMKRLNKQGPPILGGIPAPVALGLDNLRAIQRGQRKGVTLLDVRQMDAFGRVFLTGALNIGLGPSLPNWAGWAISYNDAIALIVADTSEVEEAVTWLIRIGLDTIAGYAVADPVAWRKSGLEIDQVEQIDIHEARKRLQAGETQLLDVRNPDEWEIDHVPGAEHSPVGQLARGDDNSLDPAHPVAVMCATGYRSSLGTSVLAQRGFADVINVVGGMDAWRDAGLPVERG
ncbi:MAG: rhodanese-like domain-containing protein, partial [Vicinamibacterales bacterium]